MHTLIIVVVKYALSNYSCSDICTLTLIIVVVVYVHSNYSCVIGTF